MPEHLGSTKTFEVEVRGIVGDRWVRYGSPCPTTGTIAAHANRAEREFGKDNVRVVRVIVTREAL